MAHMQEGQQLGLAEQGSRALALEAIPGWNLCSSLLPAVCLWEH